MMPVQKIANVPELLCRLSQGSEEAFNQIYNCYSDTIFNTLITYVRDPEEAKEILQQIFIKIWERRAVMAGVTNLNDYLFIATRNSVYNYFNRLSRQARLKLRFTNHQYALSATPEQGISEKEFFHLWLEAINRLPPQQRQVYQWIEQQDWTLDQASGELKLSKATVKKHLELGRKSVKAYLKNRLSSLSTDATFGMLIIFLLSHYAD